MNTPHAPEGVDVKVEADLTHHCPFVDEADAGRVTIRWTCLDATLELHELAEFLDGFKNIPISHEAIVDMIRAHLAAQPGIADVTVSATFATAGMTVTATA